MQIPHPALNCKLEYSKKAPPLTSFAGLTLLQQTMEAVGLTERMEQINIKQAGYKDSTILQALILLQAAGGQHLSDWERLTAESGFVRCFGLTPSVDTLERYLRRTTLVVPHRRSQQGQVGFIAPFEGLQSQLIQRAYQKAGQPPHLTLDLDALLIPTDKDNAQFCYKKHKAYQPMIAYCPELRMILAYEFRDGNVSPAEGYQRLVQRCLDLFDGSVTFTVRADAAAYNNPFLDYLELNNILYFITAEQSQALKASIKRVEQWTEIALNKDRTQEIALLDHVPSANSRQQMIFRNRTRNYLALRKAKQEKQKDLFGNHLYSVIVSNARAQHAADVIKTYRGRCGTVEYCNQQLKAQLGMGVMPSNDFKVNAGWFALGCITHNLLRFMQQFVLPTRFLRMEVHNLRYHLIRAAAQVLKKARRLILRFCKDYSLYQVFQSSRLKLARL